mmetsp:Transcript_1701/g.2384  ORF Transcript_1701/g.2384 Transcript_1701/m.2384 type:complete len:240 (-) Transcript_1701:403-1122(-)|eukprot:CAMPEP_0167759344 /NCGR_PEP_ID=MMETSP0110_2-20121227/10970_1 /TAXON_ID=629695 /ORGANISM="Gymnochlora sp., Strain CCMP2014" /LENGTH=239 /DNA_ID=CAMNT_0007645717 /DNA_START=80 /DNA_END=799 /DNA_ORIENTATION=+
MKTFLLVIAVATACFVIPTKNTPYVGKGVDGKDVNIVTDGMVFDHNCNVETHVVNGTTKIRSCSIYNTDYKMYMQVRGRSLKLVCRSYEDYGQIEKKAPPKKKALPERKAHPSARSTQLYNFPPDSEYMPAVHKLDRVCCAPAPLPESAQERKWKPAQKRERKRTQDLEDRAREIRLARAEARKSAWERELERAQDLARKMIIFDNESAHDERERARAQDRGRAIRAREGARHAQYYRQ